MLLKYSVFINFIILLKQNKNKNQIQNIFFTVLG
jgi:hypothetical protein